MGRVRVRVRSKMKLWCGLELEFGLYLALYSFNQ